MGMKDYYAKQKKKFDSYVDKREKKLLKKEQELEKKLEAQAEKEIAKMENMKRRDKLRAKIKKAKDYRKSPPPGQKKKPCKQTTDSGGLFGSGGSGESLIPNFGKLSSPGGNDLLGGIGMGLGGSNLKKPRKRKKKKTRKKKRTVKKVVYYR